jgi:type IV secretory pathway TraG/TraD family ATPase VirD4
MYTGFLLATAGLLYLLYYYRYFWLKHTNRIIKGHRRDSEIETNLECAKFQSEEDMRKNFVHSTFETLKDKDVAGIPIRAVQRESGYHIDLAPPAHTLVIGTTGSGKTTTFINPAIQILAESKAKPSMLISDPKGELYLLHAKSLSARGYDVKVLDLRNPFRSIRWNPLERPFLLYQRMLRIEGEAAANEETGSYTFDGKEYYDINELENAFGVKKQELFDLIYEDLHDVATVLCPVTNKQEPIWESGAKNFTLAVMLAMLEDSENPSLGMTKEKYNFYNLKAAATNTEHDCAELIRYFAGRSPTSRSRSPSRQVLDTADKTRGSYLSTLFDKLNLFADISLCSLTSANEIEFSEMADKPTALFLQIPDERETRHPLAAMVILQAYKELVRKANTYPALTLPRHVYFLLDEFGNLPPVHKLEQMITVGRSRKIWLCMVVQSYAQLSKVYDDKVAEIIKSNCNIQAFIGSTDQKTIDDFSKRCGNFSVITRNVGYNTIKADDVNSNASVKERPLIYPIELQQLNAPGNMGNTIVTVFGYQPIKSRFTPSFACFSLKMEPTVQECAVGIYFDESKTFYDIRRRNQLILPAPQPRPRPHGPHRMSGRRGEIMIEAVKDRAMRATTELLDDAETVKLLQLLDNRSFEESVKILDEANRRAVSMRQDHLISSLNDVREKLIRIMHEADGEITRHPLQMGGG